MILELEQKKTLSSGNNKAFPNYTNVHSTKSTKQTKTKANKQRNKQTNTQNHSHRKSCKIYKMLFEKYDLWWSARSIYEDYKCTYISSI